METIKQRLDGDCAVCVTAMFLGKTYNEIVNLFPEVKDGFLHGTRSEVEVCLLFGVALECKSYPGAVDKTYYGMDKSKPAMIAVMSMNRIDTLHSLYWDGEKIHDPSNLKCYDKEFPDQAYVEYILQAVGIA